MFSYIQWMDTTLKKQSIFSYKYLILICIHVEQINYITQVYLFNPFWPADEFSISFCQKNNNKNPINPQPWSHTKMPFPL